MRILSNPRPCTWILSSNSEMLKLDSDTSLRIILNEYTNLFSPIRWTEDEGEEYLGDDHEDLETCIDFLEELYEEESK